MSDPEWVHPTALPSFKTGTGIVSHLYEGEWITRFPIHWVRLYCCYVLQSVMLIPSLSSRDMFILLLRSPECNDSAYPIFLLQRYVPAWLQSTRIHHWPQDTQDLLLRLLLEERYIGPPLGKELTLSVRHLWHLWELLKTHYVVVLHRFQCLYGNLVNAFFFFLLNWNGVGVVVYLSTTLK